MHDIAQAVATSPFRCLTDLKSTDNFYELGEPSNSSPELWCTEEQCGKECTLDISGEPHRDGIIVMASDTEADSTAFMGNDTGVYAQLKEGRPWRGVHRKPLLLQKGLIQISELE